MASMVACAGEAASGVGASRGAKAPEPEAPTNTESPELTGNASTTCEDRARIAPLCTRALTERCQSQSNDCDATCDSRDRLPANTQKTPSDRTDHVAVACRQDCRLGYDACVRNLVSQCPKPCS